LDGIHISRPSILLSFFIATRYVPWRNWMEKKFPPGFSGGSYTIDVQ
jgi:hypothetical protein